MDQYLTTFFLYRYLTLVFSRESNHLLLSPLDRGQWSPKKTRNKSRQVECKKSLPRNIRKIRGISVKYSVKFWDFTNDFCEIQPIRTLKNVQIISQKSFEKSKKRLSDIKTMVLVKLDSGIFQEFQAMVQTIRYFFPSRNFQLHAKINQSSFDTYRRFVRAAPSWTGADFWGDRTLANSTVLPDSLAPTAEIPAQTAGMRITKVRWSRSKIITLRGFPRPMGTIAQIFIRRSKVVIVTFPW